MRLIAALSAATAVLLVSAPAVAMPDRYGNLSGGGRVSDPDVRLDHMAAGLQTSGSGHGKPRGMCSVLKDDPDLRHAFGCK